MATYYVDFETGNDANAGTSTGAPWQHSPGDANATGVADATSLSGGDTVTFKGGVVYLGYILLQWSGSAGNVITFDGNSAGTWGEGRAIIDGEGETLGAAARQRAIRSTSDSYIVIDNFEIRNLRYVYDDQYGNQAWAIEFTGLGTNVEIKNCYLHEIMKTPVAVLKVTDTTNTAATATEFSQTGADFSAYAGVVGLPATHKILIGWTASDYDKAWAYIGPVSPDNTLSVYEHMQLAGGEEGWAGGSPVGNDGAYFYWIYEIAGGTWNNRGGQAIGVASHNEVNIHDNTIREAKYGIRAYSDGSARENFYIHHNDVSRVSWGIQCDGPAAGPLTNVNIYNNTIHDFYQYVKDNWGWHNDGVFVWGSENPLISGVVGLNIYNNYFYGDFRPDFTALLFTKYLMTNIKIYNNVFAASSGVGLFLSLVGRESPNAWVYNNTFAKVPGGTATTVYANRVTQIDFKNNIVYLPEAYAACLDIATDALLDFDSDYNLMGSLNDSAADIEYDETKRTLEAWVIEGNFDQNSVINEDPLFVNFPRFMTEATSAYSTTRLYFKTVSDWGVATNDFNVGEHVEINYDGVVRTITDVNDEVVHWVQFTPALDEATKTGDIIINWGASENFVFDVRLQAGSPAADAGTDLSAIIGTEDIDGTTRPVGGTWDIGAYERVNPETDATSFYLLQAMQKRRSL